MSRRNLKPRARRHDRWGRFAEVMESKAQRKAARKKSDKAAHKAKKTSKKAAAKRSAMQVKASKTAAQAEKSSAISRGKAEAAKKAAATKAEKHAKRVAAGKKAAAAKAEKHAKRVAAAKKAAETRKKNEAAAAKPAAKNEAAAAKPAAKKKPKKTAAKKQAKKVKKENKAMALTNRQKAARKAARTREKNRKAEEERKAAAARKRARKAKGGAKKSKGTKKSKGKKGGAKKTAKKSKGKKGKRKATVATVPGTRRVKVGGHSRQVPSNIRITIGAPVHARKAAKRPAKRKGAREDLVLESMSNPISEEYALENPMTGGEMFLAAVTGGLGILAASGLDRYLATRDQTPAQGQPALTPAEQVASPPGILRVLAQGGIAAAAFVGAYFVPQPMGRAALQGAGLGAFSHLVGQAFMTYLVPRFFKSNDTARKMFPAEIAVYERLNPPQATTTGQQGLPMGVGGYLPRHGMGVDPAAAMIVRPQNLDYMGPALTRNPVAPPAPAANGGGGCGPCGGCGDRIEQGVPNAIENVANAANAPASTSETLSSVMSATRDAVCNPGLAGTSRWYNAVTFAPEH
jgi:hypothetical protein